jgi:hypothetical protein
MSSGVVTAGTMVGVDSVGSVVVRVSIKFGVHKLYMRGRGGIKVRYPPLCTVNPERINSVAQTRRRLDGLDASTFAI